MILERCSDSDGWYDRKNEICNKRSWKRDKEDWRRERNKRLKKIEEEKSEGKIPKITIEKEREKKRKERVEIFK